MRRPVAATSNRRASKKQREGIKDIAAPFLTTRNPIMHPRFRLCVVCFESASGKRMKAASLQRFTGLGKSHSPDSRRFTNFLAHAFDRHDAAFHNSYPVEVYIYFDASASKTPIGMRQRVVPVNTEIGSGIVPKPHDFICPVIQLARSYPIDAKADN
jgi:hypothetical protein